VRPSQRRYATRPWINVVVLSDAVVVEVDLSGVFAIAVTAVCLATGASAPSGVAADVGAALAVGLGADRSAFAFAGGRGGAERVADAAVVWGGGEPEVVITAATPTTKQATTTAIDKPIRGRSCAAVGVVIAAVIAAAAG